MGAQHSVRVDANQSGFTLIEVVIVTSLLAVLMGLAVPNFSAMIDRNRVESVMSEYAFAIRSARSMAIGRGAPTYVCPSSSADSQTPSCGDDASWEDGFIVYSKPAYTSSKLGFLPFDENADELIAQLDFPQRTSSKLDIEQINASEYIGFSNLGTVIQAAPNSNPALRVCGAAAGVAIGRVYRLSTTGRLSVTRLSDEECSNGDFS